MILAVKEKVERKIYEPETYKKLKRQEIIVSSRTTKQYTNEKGELVTKFIVKKTNLTKKINEMKKTIKQENATVTLREMNF